MATKLALDPDLLDRALALALSGEKTKKDVFTTGLVLQELLQGFRGPQAQDAIVERFSSLPFVHPERPDHIAAAELRNDCRRRGIQVGTTDALLAQLCIRFDLTLLTTDAGSAGITRHHPLGLWRAWAPPTLSEPSLRAGSSCERPREEAYYAHETYESCA